MINRITIVLLMVAFISLEASAQNRKHRRRGVILGGLAGAAIGAAIGDKGDNETAGALIGGAVGAVAGGTIGNQKDQRIEHNQRYHSGQRYPAYPHSPHPHSQYSQYYQPSYTPYNPQRPPFPQPVPGVSAAPWAPRPILPQDVVAMMQSGLSEPMIIRQIELNGVLRPLTVSEVIELHQMGVSEPILTAMQVAAPVATDPVATDNKSTFDQPQSYRIPTTPERSYGPSIVAPSNGK